jgi:hypothetical protein
MVALSASCAVACVDQEQGKAPFLHPSDFDGNGEKVRNAW